MRLVGPRPLLVQYLDRYSPRQARRHDVKPGITGLAQINGRNDIDWETKLELDLRYVEHCSFLLNIKTLLLTFQSVVRRDGISQLGHATAPEFTGTAVKSTNAVDAGGTAKVQRPGRSTRDAA